MGQSSDDSLSNAIPMLRRYAFCLTGTREAGDILIEQALQDIADGHVSADGSPATLSLFRAFHTSGQRHGSFETLDAVNARSADDPVHSKLLALPLELRQALVLVRTIGFTCGEAAEILDQSDDLIEHWAAAAFDHVFADKSTRLHLVGKAGRAAA